MRLMAEVRGSRIDARPPSGASMSYGNCASRCLNPQGGAYVRRAKHDLCTYTLSSSSAVRCDGPTSSEAVKNMQLVSRGIKALLPE
jgi:hypothetical protein